MNKKKKNKKNKGVKISKAGQLGYSFLQKKDFRKKSWTSLFLLL